MDSYPTIKLIYDRRKIANSEKEGIIEIEIYFNRIRKRISTGVKVLPKNWDSRKTVVIGRSDSLDLNLKINFIKNKIQTYINQLMIDSVPFTWNKFNSFIENKTGKDSFINFVERLVNTREDICAGTKRNHQKLVKALKEFGIIREFSDLTKANIVKYDNWLHKRKNIQQSTVACYHKFLKIYINESIRREIITINPYIGIKIDTGKSAKRRFLTEIEIEKIKGATLATSSLEKVRDLFLFQMYTGLAYCDLKRFDFKKTINRNGKQVLLDQRQKTGEDYYIVLLPHSIKILEKYNNVLPLMSLEQYNMRLKIIADAAGIEKRLTSHMARHTYATLCLNAGISIEILAKMMGHSDIKTTQIYATLVNPTVEAAFEELEKKLS